jgi:hypothetical protein
MLLSAAHQLEQVLLGEFFVANVSLRLDGALGFKNLIVDLAAGPSLEWS